MSMELAHNLERSPYCHCQAIVHTEKLLLTVFSKEPSPQASVEVSHSHSIAIHSSFSSILVWSLEEASFSVT